MTLQDITILLRDLANDHVEINGFYTGLAHESNDSNIQYPALRVTYPYSVVAGEEADTLSLTFNLSLTCNEVSVDTGTLSYEVNTNFNSQNDTLNEIDEDLTDENELREKALRILCTFIEGLRLKEDEPGYFQLTDGWTVNSLERYANDFVTGVRSSLTITVSNDYKCQSQENIDNSIWKDENYNLLDIDYIVHSDCPPPTPAAPFANDYAMSFSLNEKLSMSYDSLLDFERTDSFTTSTQYRYVASTTSVYFFSKMEWAPAYNGWNVSYDPITNRLLFVLRNYVTSNDLLVYATPTFTLGEVYDIKFTYNGNSDASGVVIYVDGVPLTNVIIRNGLSATTKAGIGLTIGSWNNIYSTCEMNVGRVWNVAMTPSQVITEYNGGVPTFATLDSNLILECLFGDGGTFGTNAWMLSSNLGDEKGLQSTNMTYANRIASF